MDEQILKDWKILHNAIGTLHKNETICLVWSYKYILKVIF